MLRHKRKGEWALFMLFPPFVPLGQISPLFCLQLFTLLFFFLFFPGLSRDWSHCWPDARWQSRQAGPGQAGHGHCGLRQGLEGQRTRVGHWRLLSHCANVSLKFLFFRYDVELCSLHPLTCTPKNNLLIGFNTKKKSANEMLEKNLQNNLRLWEKVRKQCGLILHTYKWLSKKKIEVKANDFQK